MTRLPRSLLICLIVVAGFSGCTFYPLGMTENEWHRLTPQQQLDARTQQTEIDRDKAVRRAEEARRREAEERRLAAARQRRIDRLYAHNRYGDILRCSIEGGVFDFKPGWRPLAPVSFATARGEQGYVTFRQLNGRKHKKVWIEYSDDGHELKICHAKDHYECGHIGGSQSDFARGIYLSPTNFEGLMHSNQIECGY